MIVHESDGETPNRVERFRMRASRRRNIAMVAAVAVLVAAVAGAVAWRFVGASAPSATARGPVSGLPVSGPTTVTSSGPATASAVARIEVPNLAGMTVVEAGAVLKAAGLGVRASTEGTVGAPSDVLVRSQSPEAGTVTTAGSVVTIVIPVAAAKGMATKSAAPKRPTRRFVVVIDPGHQSHADASLEPMAPGSTEMKPRMSAGVTGIASQVPEYEVDLELATNLKERLEAAGVRVVMTRTTNDVDLSNVERAKIANEAHADLFVRVHTDSSPDAQITGVSTLFPAANQWTKPIAQASQRAAFQMQQRLVSFTGAVDGGAVAHTDIAGFNWSKVPAVLVKAGYQSNPVEDRLLASSHYQDEVAQGIAAGVLGYLETEPPR